MLNSAVETHDEQSPFAMTISLSVLDDLGIRLYSKIPAVLSEVVANAWDADAQLVDIIFDRESNTIIIQDDGKGMTESDINKKYLTVGYRKRDNEPAQTPAGRSPMGRKGIGKLSVFSIATTVEVHTICKGQGCALRMNSDDIKSVIKKNDVYKPKPIPLDSEMNNLTSGTKIILRDLRKNIATSTDDTIRKQLSRRFSIIGHQNNFMVRVNNEEISAKDRDYYNLIQFMWYLGSESRKYTTLCQKLEESYEYSNIVTVDSSQYKISGWIGTVFESGKLDNDTNSIILFANGKLIHEDVLSDLNETGVYASYIIGEIDADFIDKNDEDDIITSARQSVQQNAERYIQIKEFIRSLLKNIQSNWTGLREDKGAKRLLEYASVREWYERLPGDQKIYAKQTLGRLDGFRLPDLHTKGEFVKASMLLFERMAKEHQLSILDKINTQEEFELLQSAIAKISELEKVSYYQIAKSRINIIDKLQEAVSENAKEQVIQQMIFKYLWLLDSSWEMATGTSIIEKAITSQFQKMEDKLSPEEKLGRVDIRYQTITGKHVIVELKRPGVHLSVFDLAKQVNRYRETLETCLKDYYPNQKHHHIECICIIGQTPKEGAEKSSKVLDAINARFVTYNELIQRAKQSYKDFLEAQIKISEILEIIDNVDKDFRD